MEWKQDYTALVVSYVYVFGIIAIAELLRRAGRRPTDFTRKFIHVGVGMWSIGTVALFETWQMAIIPPISFVLINAFSYWRGVFQAMESEERGNLGTIYFPIAFAVAIYAFWEEPMLLVACLMPMTWGDAMAAIVGRQFGHYTWTIGGHTRSLEGSLAMLIWSWVATSAALFGMPFLIGLLYVSWLTALIYGGLVALVCTVVEALSPWGLDNLTVPLAAGLVLNMLFG